MARKFFSVPFLTLRGKTYSAAPPLSVVGESRIYYDKSFDTLMVSNDGYQYLPIGTGSVTLEGVGSVSAPISTKTSNYDATVNDHTLLCDASGGAFAIALPPAESAFSGGNGTILYIKKIDSGSEIVTVGTSGGQLIDGASTQSLAAQNESITVQSDGSAWWII